jgi:hypothetical protein
LVIRDAYARPVRHEPARTEVRRPQAVRQAGALLTQEERRIAFFHYL